VLAATNCLAPTESPTLWPTKIVGIANTRGSLTNGMMQYGPPPGPPFSRFVAYVVPQVPVGRFRAGAPTASRIAIILRGKVCEIQSMARATHVTRHCSAPIVGDVRAF
jgi:hypothetical protein